MSNRKPIIWRGITFLSQKECASILDVDRHHLAYVYKQKGTVDHIKPGRSSVHYIPRHRRRKVSRPKQRVDRIKTVYRGRTFNSRLECAEYLGYDYSYLIYVLKRKGSIDHFERKTIGKQPQAPHVCSVSWNGIEFISQEDCARQLELSIGVVGDTLRTFGNIDHLVPGYNSAYYSKSIDPREKKCFIKQAIKKHGVENVAKAYGVSHQRMCKALHNNKLFLWRISKWNDKQFDIKYKSKKELIQTLKNPPRRPYIYVIEWSKYNKRYIGSRVVEYCNPAELGNTFFGDTLTVRRFVRKFGKPDKSYYIEYHNIDDTLRAERFCLMLLAQSSKYRTDYINKGSWLGDHD